MNEVGVVEGAGLRRPVPPLYGVQTSASYFTSPGFRAFLCKNEASATGRQSQTGSQHMRSPQRGYWHRTDWSAEVRLLCPPGFPATSEPEGRDGQTKEYLHNNSDKPATMTMMIPFITHLVCVNSSARSMNGRSCRSPNYPERTGLPFPSSGNDVDDQRGGVACPGPLERQGWTALQIRLALRRETIFSSNPINANTEVCPGC